MQLCACMLWVPHTLFLRSGYRGVVGGIFWGYRPWGCRGVSPRGTGNLGWRLAEVVAESLGDVLLLYPLVLLPPFPRVTLVLVGLVCSLAHL